MPIIHFFLLSLGPEIGCTVPSTNSPQLLKTAPFWWMVLQKPCKHCGDNHGWFKLLNKWSQFSYIKFVIWLQIIYNWGMDLTKIYIISITYMGKQNVSKLHITNASTPSTRTLFQCIISSGIFRVALRSYVWFFGNLNVIFTDHYLTFLGNILHSASMEYQDILIFEGSIII